MKTSLGISNFLDEISSLSNLLFSSISLHWSLRKTFLSLLAILWNSAFKWVYLSFSLLPFTCLLFIAVCKASSDNHFVFLHFFFLGMVLIIASCTMSYWSSYEDIPHNQGQRSPSKMVGAGVVAAWRWSDFEEIPHVQGQRRRPRKMVGGVKSHLESNPIPARDAQRSQK